jgi:hypothetical protein
MEKQLQSYEKDMFPVQDLKGAMQNQTEYHFPNDLTRFFTVEDFGKNVSTAEITEYKKSGLDNKEEYWLRFLDLEDNRMLVEETGKPNWNTVYRRYYMFKDGKMVESEKEIKRVFKDQLDIDVKSMKMKYNPCLCSLHTAKILTKPEEEFDLS